MKFLMLLAAMASLDFSDDAHRAVVRAASPYRTCITQNVTRADTGRPDAALVARIVAERCEASYRKFRRAVIKFGRTQVQPIGIARNYDAALAEVRKERRAKSVPNSN